MSSNPSMHHIPPLSLQHLPTRITYLQSFLSFTTTDGSHINASARILAPLLPALLDGVYTKLLSYDITAAAFAKPQPGLPASKARRVEDLDLESTNIAHRKAFLKAYLVRLVGCETWGPEADVWAYLDKVGVYHTGQQADAAAPARGEGNGVGDLARAAQRMGSKRRDLRVEYVHLGLLLAWVEDAVVGAILGDKGTGEQEKEGMIRAWNKLLWIQNDLFAKHYVVDEASGTGPKLVQTSTSGLGALLLLIIGFGLGFLFSDQYVKGSLK